LKFHNQKKENANEGEAMKKTKAQEALRIAKNLAKQAKSATDFHNAFFGIGGRFGELFPERTEREAFGKSPEYREIVRLREALRQSQKAAS
jgi:phage anti-repressor protein